MSAIICPRCAQRVSTRALFCHRCGAAISYSLRAYSAEYQELLARVKEVEPLRARVASLENKELKTSRASESLQYERLRAELNQLESLPVKVGRLETENKELRAKGDEQSRTQLKEAEFLRAKVSTLEAENKKLATKLDESLRMGVDEIRPLRARIAALEGKNKKLKSIRAKADAEYGPHGRAIGRRRVRHRLATSPRSRREGLVATTKTEPPRIVQDSDSTTNTEGVADPHLDASTQPGGILTETMTETHTQEETREARSDQSPDELLSRTRKFEKENKTLREPVWKDRIRRLDRIIRSYGMLGVGGLCLILSLGFWSAGTPFMFVGLALTFCGAVFVFITRPWKHVRSDLMDSTALSSLAAFDHFVFGLGYSEKGIYIPSEVNPGNAVVFVPSQPLKEIPKAEQLERQTFVVDPKGVAMVPPGLSFGNPVRARTWGRVRQMPSTEIE
jgi:hypothetical protein